MLQVDLIEDYNIFLKKLDIDRLKEYIYNCSKNLNIESNHSECCLLFEVIVDLIEFNRSKQFDSYGKILLDVFVNNIIGICFNKIYNKNIVNISLRTKNLDIIKYFIKDEENMLSCDLLIYEYSYMYRIVMDYENILKYLVKLGYNINKKCNITKFSLFSTIAETFGICDQTLYVNTNHQNKQHYCNDLLVNVRYKIIYNLLACGLDLRIKYYLHNSFVFEKIINGWKYQTYRLHLKTLNYLMDNFINFKLIDVNGIYPEPNKIFDEQNNSISKEQFDLMISNYKQLLQTREDYRNIIMRELIMALIKVENHPNSFRSKVFYMNTKIKYQNADINVLIKDFKNDNLNKIYLDMFSNNIDTHIKNIINELS